MLTIINACAVNMSNDLEFKDSDNFARLYRERSASMHACAWSSRGRGPIYNVFNCKIRLS